MAEYQYQGVDKKGARVKGKLQATSEGELRMILRGQGIRPVKIGKVGMLEADLGSLFSGGKIGRIPVDNLSVFTRQLHVLVGSGIPLVQALEVLGEQTPHPGLRRITIAVKEKIAQGSFFWESLNTYGKSFPRIFISLIRAGESSGAMEKVLDRLAVYLESSHRLQRMVKSAMMYPAIVVVIAFAVIGIMLTVVIPKFEDMLKSANQSLPAPTQFLINTSHFVQNNFIMLAGIVAVVVYSILKYARTEEGRGVLQTVMFKLPVFGELIQKAGIARFSRTLGTLLASGVNLLDGLDISRETIDNAVIEDALKVIRKDIEAGKALSSTLNRLKVFPKMAVQMVAVGESTGNLENMMERLADIYESDVETMVNGLSKLIEPLMIAFLGVVVGGMLIAMYLPIFKLAGSAGG